MSERDVARSQMRTKLTRFPGDSCVDGGGNLNWKLCFIFVLVGVGGREDFRPSGRPPRAVIEAQAHRA